VTLGLGPRLGDEQLDLGELALDLGGLGIEPSRELAGRGQVNPPAS
jgi:hypothetical protein